MKRILCILLLALPVLSYGQGHDTAGVRKNYYHATNGVQAFPQQLIIPLDTILAPYWNGAASIAVKDGILYYHNGTAFITPAQAGSGVTSITAGNGLLGGTITTTGTFRLDTDKVRRYIHDSVLNYVKLSDSGVVYLTLHDTAGKWLGVGTTTSSIPEGTNKYFTDLRVYNDSTVYLAYVKALIASIQANYLQKYDSAYFATHADVDSGVEHTRRWALVTFLQSYTETDPLSFHKLDSNTAGNAVTYTYYYTHLPPTIDSNRFVKKVDSNSNGGYTSYYYAIHNFLTAEVDPVANTKMVTSATGWGLTGTNSSQSIGSNPSVSYAADSSKVATHGDVDSAVEHTRQWAAAIFLTSYTETDPVATAKTLTSSTGWGLTGTNSSQTIGSSPSVTYAADSSKVATHGDVDSSSEHSRQWAAASFIPLSTFVVAHRAYIGPVIGSPAAPTFRSLEPTDIPYGYGLANIGGFIVNDTAVIFPVIFSTLGAGPGINISARTVINYLSVGQAGGQTVIGGTASTDQLNFKSTTGNQTSGLAYTWLSGNNGSSTIMKLSYNGHLTIEGVTSTGATGTGNFVFATSPSLTTPSLGVATATSINGNALTTGSWTVNGGAAKTFTFNNTLTFTGTDGTTMTFPGTSQVVAGLAAQQAWTKGQAGVISTLTDASTIAVDLSLGNNLGNVVMAGNRTLGVPTNIVAGQSGTMTFDQDITGTRTLTPAWIYGGSGGTPIVLSTGKLAHDVVSYYVNYYSSATVTISNATPGVVTQTGHGYPIGSCRKLQLTTTGTLPTGLSPSTTYYATIVDANTYKLSTSYANAQAGTFINTSSAGSGTHTSTIGNITLAILTDSR